jgi:hypothetical protein
MRSPTCRQSVSVILPQSMTVHPLKSEQKLGENARLLKAREGAAPWRQWVPYLSERQWSTIREDYSEHGTAWDYFPHDHARSAPVVGVRTASRDFVDDKQLLCFALALWNGSDPILKNAPKCDGSPRLTENETNDRRIFGTANGTAFVKDGINDFLLHSRITSVNPTKTGN